MCKIRWGNTYNKECTECLCGARWRYGYVNKDRPHKKHNIIWRELDAVSCDKCKETYETNQ